VAEQGSADPGEEAGEQEALRLHQRRAHGEGAGGVLVVAHRHQQPAEAAAADVAGQQHRQRQHRQGEPVVVAAGVERDVADDGPAGVDAVAEHEALLQQVGRHDQGERQRGDGQEQAADAQRGQPDHQRGGGTGQPRVQERQLEVADAAGHLVRHPRPYRGYRELPQRQLAPEPRHDADRQPDDRETHDRDHRDGGRVADEQRQHRRHGKGGGPEEQAEVAHQPDLLQRLRDRAQRLHCGPAALLLLAATALLLQQQGEQDDDEQHHLHETGLRAVPQQQLLEDAEREAARQGDRQAVHPGQYGGGECAQQQPGPEGLPGGEPSCRLGQDRGEGGERPRSAHARDDMPSGRDARHACGLGLAAADRMASPNRLYFRKTGQQQHSDRPEEEHAAVGLCDAQRAELEHRQARRLREQRAGAPPVC
jgi:hypothetical protein